MSQGEPKGDTTLPEDGAPTSTYNSPKASRGLSRDASEASTSSDSSTHTAILINEANSAALGKGRPSQQASTSSSTRTVSSSHSTPASSKPNTATLPFLPLSAQQQQPTRNLAGVPALKPPITRSASTSRPLMSRNQSTTRGGELRAGKGKGRAARRIASSTSASDDDFDVLSEGGFSSKAGGDGSNDARRLEPNSDDDEVRTVDRGEMLIKKRMRERKKQKQVNETLVQSRQLAERVSQ